MGAIASHFTSLDHDYLLIRSFGRRSRKTPKLRVTGRCDGNSPVADEFLTQRTSNAVNVSIWWPHHDESIWMNVNLCRFLYMNLMRITYTVPYNFKIFMVWVSVVGFDSDLCFTTGTAVLYLISLKTGSCSNGTWLQLIYYIELQRFFYGA